MSRDTGFIKDKHNINVPYSGKSPINARFLPESGMEASAYLAASGQHAIDRSERPVVWGRVPNVYSEITEITPSGTFTFMSDEWLITSGAG